MKRWTAVALVLAAVCAGLLLWRARADRDAARAPAGPSESELLVRAVTPEPGAAAGRRERASGAAGTGSEAHDPGLSISASEAEAEQQWRSEPKAPRLRDFESAVQAAFDDPVFAGGRLLAVDCRTTLCRLELELPNDALIHQIGIVAQRYDALRGSMPVGVPHRHDKRLVMFTTPRPEGVAAPPPTPP